jgi:hypothetical protein
MRLDRADAEVQTTRNLFVAAARNQVLQNFQLARRERRLAMAGKASP